MNLLVEKSNNAIMYDKIRGIMLSNKIGLEHSENLNKQKYAREFVKEDSINSGIYSPKLDFNICTNLNLNLTLSP